jgi:UDP-N-acetylmuramate: L-alanyl-gamma-D-glutamyl-meso-diaminopimelate ligase
LLNKKDEEVPIQVFGEHNLRNISAAKEVCKQLGIKGKDFFKAVASFPGAARRLELVREVLPRWCTRTLPTPRASSKPPPRP